MDTMKAYAKCQVAKANNNPLKELDWESLMAFVEESEDLIESIYAGLEEDWEWTGDEVYYHECGWIDDNMAYTESIWATPIAFIHYLPEVDDDKLIDIYSKTL